MMCWCYICKRSSQRGKHCSSHSVNNLVREVVAGKSMPSPDTLKDLSAPVVGCKSLNLFLIKACKRSEVSFLPLTLKQAWRRLAGIIAVFAIHASRQRATSSSSLGPIVLFPQMVTMNGPVDGDLALGLANICVWKMNVDELRRSSFVNAGARHAAPTHVLSVTWLGSIFLDCVGLNRPFLIDVVLIIQRLLHLVANIVWKHQLPRIICTVRYDHFGGHSLRQMWFGGNVYIWYTLTNVLFWPLYQCHHHNSFIMICQCVSNWQLNLHRKTIQRLKSVVFCSLIKMC